MRNNAALRLDDTDKAASSIKKGRTVKSIDHALWERELAEYLSLHPDLEGCLLRFFRVAEHG